MSARKSKNRATLISALVSDTRQAGKSVKLQITVGRSRAVTPSRSGDVITVGRSGAATPSRSGDVITLSETQRITYPPCLKP